MKSLIVELVYFISLFIAANMIYFDIYPQYHGFCIDWLILGCFGGIIGVIKKMVIHCRKRNHCKDIQK